MKKLIFLICGVLWISLSYSQGYTIEKFSADIHISPKGYFDVVEEYEVNFQQLSHGIYRDIITKYDFMEEDGESSRHTIYISNIKVPGHKFKVPSQWGNNSSKLVQIKIGDPDKWVSGNQTYRIEYRVKNAFITSDSLVQLYWNVKPSNWQTEFQEVQFRVHAPKGVELNTKNSFVYAGQMGVSEVSEDFEYGFEGSIFYGKSKEGFTSQFGESVTLLVKMPESEFKSVSYAPPWWKTKGWIALAPAVLLLFGRLWYKYGKEDKVATTTAYYPPKGIDPPIANYLLKNKADNTGLIALIPEWGHQGLLRVEEVDLDLMGKIKGEMGEEARARMEEGQPSWIKKGVTFLKNKVGKKDIQLLRKKELPAGAHSYERRIFDGLFETYGDTVRISELQNKFYKTMEKARKDLRQEAETFYDRDSLRVGKYASWGATVMTFGVPFLFGYLWGVIAAVVAGLIGMISIFFSSLIQKKNEKGRMALSELKGFKEFIRLAEIDRIKMLLEEDPDYFEKTMGYAVAFGLLAKWAKKFEALNIEPPEWYGSRSVSAMSMNSFANSFSQSMSKAQSSMVSAPRSNSSSSSSGGGSSGGGFGGGGGGRW